MSQILVKQTGVEGLALSPLFIWNGDLCTLMHIYIYIYVWTHVWCPDNTCPGFSRLSTFPLFFFSFTDNLSLSHGNLRISERRKQWFYRAYRFQSGHVLLHLRGMQMGHLPAYQPCHRCFYTAVPHRTNLKEWFQASANFDLVVIRIRDMDSRELCVRGTNCYVNAVVR